MAGEGKNFDSPDETRPFEGKGQADVLNIGGKVVGKAVFEPGWKWSENVKPIAQTDSCQVSHLGYCISGSMTVLMDDGSQLEIGPGDVFAIPPGHDPEAVRSLLEEADAEILPGRGLDFRDPWGNHVQVVEYGDIQFTKAREVLRGMGMEGLEKSPDALRELR